MNPYTLVAWCIIAAVVAAVLPYIIGRRALARKGRRVVMHDADPYAGLLCSDEPESPALRAARERFRPEEVATEQYRNGGTPMIGKHPALIAPYGRPRHWPTPRVFLTPRQIERVNIQRKLAGRPALNRRGFSNAISHACVQPVPPPVASIDWLTYLMLYECFWTDHTGPVGHVGGITIDPNQPYNGHEGEFAGAGASGQWTTPDAPTIAAATAISMGAVYMGDRAAYTDPLSDPDSYKGGDPAVQAAPNLGDGSGPGPSYSDPSPAPSSAPDPSPSYDSGSSSSSYDSGSSSSFDSGSSSSFDGGSSGSF